MNVNKECICYSIIQNFNFLKPDLPLSAKKRENNNEGFDYLHIVLMILVYALAKISQFK